LRLALLPAALRLDVLELAALEDAVQRAGQIAADGRLFCNDKGLSHPKHHSDLSKRRQAGILGRMRPSPFYMFAGIVSQPVKWLYRLRAEGVENVPKDGGFVLAANRFSNFDPWALRLPLFPRRYLRFMAKSELLSSP